jgi:hypothetical protein
VEGGRIESSSDSEEASLLSESTVLGGERIALLLTFVRLRGIIGDA